TTLISAFALAACQPRESAVEVQPQDDRALFFFGHVHELETRVGGRIGVAALNTADDFVLTHRADERFAMCSMFKWLLAAQTLHMDMNAPGYRARQIRFTAAELQGLGHTPETTANVQRGSMSVEELARAA